MSKDPHLVELEKQNEKLREYGAKAKAELDRYTELYDFAPAGYVSLSVDSVIREINLPGTRLLGSARGHLVGGRFRQFVSDNTRPIFDSWLKEIFETEVKQTCGVTLVREGRPPLAVEIEAMLSLDKKEARTVMVDITARRAMEEQLRQTQKMEVIGQLAGGVAHDFNNILAAMILNLNMVQKQHQLPAEVQLALQDVEILAKRAASLTRQLLLFSRQQAIQPEQLEINAELTHLLQTLERLLGENITCRQIVDSPELWVEADMVMLDQAMMNICLNARDAMPNGGTLTLEASLTEFDAESVPLHPGSRPGRFVCLRISDTGCGMNEEVLQHLFEPFFTTKEVGRGTGLGLASVYGIMRQHKGWVNVESVVGSGTSFRLYLPVSAKTEAAHPVPAETLQPRGQNETILLVEDEPSLLLANTHSLTLLGYNTVSAANGHEALVLWEKHRDSIDLLLTDMRMPRGISGLDLAEKFWKTKPSLKVIIMSGYSMEMVRDGMADNLNFTILIKPFDLKTLEKTIRHCLSLR